MSDDDQPDDALPSPADLEPIAFEPGVRDDLSHLGYLTIPAFSASLAKRMIAASPMHADYDRRNPPAERRPTVVGTVTHMAILEPQRLPHFVRIVPDHAPKRPSVTQRHAAKPSAATVEAIQWWDDWEKYARLMHVVKMNEFDRAVAMGEAVRRHPIAGDLLADGKAEVTLQWLDAKLGIRCKSRMDWLTPDDWIIDIKTCRDASPEGFRRACLTYGYHFQHVHYCWGFEHVLGRSPRGFLFVAVEPDPPHGVAVYVMPSDAILFAQHQVGRAMHEYAQALRSKHWRGYPDTVLPVPFSRFDLQVRTPDIAPRPIPGAFLP